MKPAEHCITFSNFDTVNTVAIWDGPEAVLSEIRKLCSEFEGLFSKFRQDSDIWRLNHANGRPVAVSLETARLLELAKEYGKRTGGVFDITIGSFNRHWNFRDGIIPSADLLAQERAGYSSLHITGCCAILPAGWEVDLGGIAKGYITDRIVQLLRDRGVTCATVNLGGNVFVLGSRPDGSPWRVGIQTPGAPVGNYCAAILAENSSVVTSGVYERGFEQNQIRYHHILDPHTGMPAQNDLVAVTLVTPLSVEGDACTTACLCMGAKWSRDFCSSLPNTCALFLKKTGDLEWYGPREQLIAL